MVRRILVGLAAAGVRDVLYMPEGYGIVPRALSDLEALETPVNVAPVDIYLHNTQEDTINAAALMMGLSLTFDHRVEDGAPAAEFLKTLVEYLAEPALLLF